MKNFEYIMSYKKGDLLPHYLIAIEPTDEDSIQGNLYFNTDGHLIRVNNRFWVIPDDLNPPPIGYSDGANCALHAICFDLVIPTKTWTLCVNKSSDTTDIHYER